VRGTLERVAYTFGRSLGERAKQERVIDRKELSDALHVRGYEPFEDEHRTVRLRNCPFDTVARQCPKVACSLNLCLREGLIKGLELSHARAIFEPDEGHCCVVITASKDGPR